MSPASIYAPRGFRGAYDHRFTKPFQSGTTVAPPDPNANVVEAHAVGITVRPHAQGMSGRLIWHAVAAGVTLGPHAWGSNLEVYAIG